MTAAPVVVSERERSHSAGRERRRRYCLIARRALDDQQRWTREAVAESLGVNRGLAARRLDPDDEPSLRLEDLAPLTEATGTALIEAVASDCGGTFVPDPEPGEHQGDEEDLFGHAAESAASWGHVVEEVRRARSGKGKGGQSITAAELAHIEADARRHVANVLAFVGAVRAAAGVRA